MSDARRFEKQTGKQAGHLYNRFTSQIDDIIAKVDFDYYLSSHQVKFGGGITRHRFSPTINKINRFISHENYADTSFGSPIIKALSIVLYAENRINISEKLMLNAGLHFAGFNENRHTYLSLQPRIIGSYEIRQYTSFQVSYTEMMQPVHLLSNNDAGLPTDLWVPATKEVPPQVSSMISVGTLSNAMGKTPLKWSVEGFYKTLRHLIEFSENASFFTGAADWRENIVMNGEGNIYGIEFLLQKTQGKTTGWMSYTLSYNNRQFKI